MTPWTPFSREQQTTKIEAQASTAALKGSTEDEQFLVP